MKSRFFGTEWHGYVVCQMADKNFLGEADLIVGVFLSYSRALDATGREGVMFVTPVRAAKRPRIGQFLQWTRSKGNHILSKREGKKTLSHSLR